MVMDDLQKQKERLAHQEVNNISNYGVRAVNEYYVDR